MLKLGLSSLKDPVLIDTVIQMFAVKSVHYADNIHAVWLLLHFGGIGLGVPKNTAYKVRTIFFCLQDCCIAHSFAFPPVSLAPNSKVDLKKEIMCTSKKYALTLPNMIKALYLT